MTLLSALLLASAVAAPSAAPHETTGIGNPPAAVAASGLPAALEARVDAWARDTMRLIYEGRPAEAAALVGDMIEAAPEDPRPYLLQARVLREGVSDQNNMRESLKPQVAPIQFVVDQCVEHADEILQRDPDSLHGLLYRGWGKMFKAQLHALAYEHWGAGRTAKSGKKDLDEFMKHAPDNGDALMIRGTYEYFADTLPAIMRLASFLLRIPGGNRIEGLALLERAGESDGYFRDDARGVRGAALFGFEGALEEALPIFDGFVSEYPENPRFVEPIGLLALFFPDRLGADLPLLDNAVRIGEESADPRIRNLGDRVRLYQAMTELFSGRIEEARTNLEILHEKDLPEPDWIREVVYRMLADIHLMLGERDRAVTLYRELDPDRNEDENIEKLLRFLNEENAGSKASDAAEVRTLRGVQPLARALYEGRLSEAERGLAALAKTMTDTRGAPVSPPLAFYRGELLTLQGRDDAAMREYRKLTEEELPERWRLFQYFARLRLAEAHARAGDPEAARDRLEDAMRPYPTRDLLRHVTRARQRYFERFEERKLES